MIALHNKVTTKHVNSQIRFQIILFDNNYTPFKNTADAIYVA